MATNWLSEAKELVDTLTNRIAVINVKTNQMAIVKAEALMDTLVAELADVKYEALRDTLA